MIIFGTLNLVTFAHGEVYVVAAFVGYFALAVYHLPWPVALLAGMLAGAVLGVLTERLAFRPMRNAGHMPPLLITIGLSIILKDLAMIVWGAENRAVPSLYDQPIDVGGVQVSLLQIVIVALAAGLVAAAAGAAIAVPTLRLRGIFLALVTIGFQEIAFLVTMNWTSLTRGPMGIPRIPPPGLPGLEFRSNVAFYYLILALDLVVLFVIARLVTSRIGRTFVAVREDELAAQSCAVPVFRYKVLSFVVATFFAGIAGGFFAHHARFVSADSFRLDETFIILTMLIVGGMGSFIGPVIGAVALVILPEAFRFLAEYRGVVYGVILIGVILFRAEGIAGVPGIIQPRGAPRVPTVPPAPMVPEAAETAETAPTSGGLR